MTMFTRGLVAGALLAGLGAALAGPASAQPLSGSYTGTVTAVEPAGKGVSVGSTTTFTLTSCGPDCTTIAAPHVSTPWSTDLHLDGDLWTGTATQGSAVCALTLDSNALVLTTDCTSASLTIHQKLTRNA